MHFRFGHRGSEVVFGDDLRLNFFAQLHRLVGSFDFHFIFGLAIFFDDERTVADHVSLRLRDDFRHTVFFNGEGHHHFFGNPDYVSPQRSVRRYGPLAIDARPAICFCFDFVNDITLRISNLHPALLVRVAVVVRIKARLASPQAILDRMSRPIHRPVSNRIHLQRAVVQRLQCFRIPDVHKPVVCQPTLFRARNHDPLILRNQIFGIGRVQAIRICAGGKAAGKDFVVLILAILLSPPEELQVRTSDRRTGHGISHKIHGAVFHTLATDRSISHPQHNARLVAVLHLCRDPVGSGFLQRRRHSRHRIEVIFRSLQIEFPLRDGLFKVLRLIVANQPPADVVNLQLHAVELLRFAFDVLTDIRQQFVDLNGASFKRRFVAVAISDIERRAFSCRLHRCAFDLHPVLLDLIDASLNTLPVVLDDRQLQHLTKQISCLRILMPIHAFVNERFQSLSLCLAAACNDSFQDYDVIEFIRKCEPLHAGRQLCDRLGVGQFMRRPFSGRLWLFIAGFVACCSLTNDRRPANSRSSNAELRLQKAGPLEIYRAAAIGDMLHHLSQSPAPAFAVGLCCVPRFRLVMKNRIAILIDRSTFARRTPTAAPVTTAAFGNFKIRQRLQICQILQLPCFTMSRTADLIAKRLP